MTRDSPPGFLTPERSYKLSIVVAGNTTAPCLAALKKKRYEIFVSFWLDGKQSSPEDYAPTWVAVKDGRRFAGGCVEEVLGLISMWETRGDHWRASSAEFDDYWNMIDEAPVYREDENGNAILITEERE